MDALAWTMSRSRWLHATRRHSEPAVQCNRRQAVPVSCSAGAIACLRMPISLSRYRTTGASVTLQKPPQSAAQHQQGSHSTRPVKAGSQYCHSAHANKAPQGCEQVERRVVRRWPSCHFDASCCLAMHTRQAAQPYNGEEWRPTRTQTATWRHSLCMRLTLRVRPYAHNSEHAAAPYHHLLSAVHQQSSSRLGTSVVTRFAAPCQRPDCHPALHQTAHLFTITLKPPLCPRLFTGPRTTNAQYHFASRLLASRSATSGALAITTVRYDTRTDHATTGAVVNVSVSKLTAPVRRLACVTNERAQVSQGPHP